MPDIFDKIKDKAEQEKEEYTDNSEVILEIIQKSNENLIAEFKKDISAVGAKIPPEMQYSYEVKIPPIDESKIKVPEIKIPKIEIPKPEITINTEVNLKETNEELKGIKKLWNDVFEKTKNFFSPFFGEKTISVRLVDKNEEDFWDYSDIEAGQGNKVIGVGGRAVDPVKLKDSAGTIINPATKDAQTDGSQKAQIVDASGSVITSSALNPAPTDRGVVSRNLKVEYATQIDEASSTITYIGYAALGVATSAASWRIKRISISGTVTSIAFADGNANYDQSWDGRAGYAYS